MRDKIFIITALVIQQSRLNLHVASLCVVYHKRSPALIGAFYIFHCFDAILVLLLLLNCFSCVRLCATPEMAAHQAPCPWDSPGKNTDWVAISFSSSWKWKVKVKSLSRVRLFETPWTAAYQAPPSMGFSRQEYWSGVPLPSPICMCRVPLSWISFPFRSPESIE